MSSTQVILEGRLAARNPGFHGAPRGHLKSSDRRVQMHSPRANRWRGIEDSSRTAPSEGCVRYSHLLCSFFIDKLWDRLSGGFVNGPICTDVPLRRVSCVGLFSRCVFSGL